MSSLPPSFLQERDLVLGRVSRHDDVLRILYCDLNSLDLALEYCDDRYARQKLQQSKAMMMLNQSSAASSSVYHRSLPIDGQCLPAPGSSSLRLW
jgi:hypothetical protein